MQGEDLLAADTVGNTANGDGLADAAMLTGNDSTLENLDTRTGAFLDTNVHTNGIANLNFGQLFLHVLAIQSLNKIHFFVLLKILGVHTSAAHGRGRTLISDRVILSYIF